MQNLKDIISCLYKIKSTESNKYIFMDTHLLNALKYAPEQHEPFSGGGF